MGKLLSMGPKKLKYITIKVGDIRSFHELLESDNVEAVRILMSTVNRYDRDCSTKKLYYDRFLFLITCGDFKSVNLMLRAGVDRGYINYLSDKQLGPLPTCPLQSAMHIRFKSARLKMMEQLLEFGVGLKENSSSPQLYQEQFLHTVVREGDCDLLKLLVTKAGARLDHFHPNTGDAPIHLVTKFHEKDLCAKMIKQLVQLGADINMRNLRGATCMHLVSSRTSNRCEVAKMLLDAGAQLNIPPDDPDKSRGPSPLASAVFLRDYELAKLMVEAGAEVNESPKLWKTSPLYFAVGHRPRQKDVLKLLLEHGADVNVKDGENNFLYSAATHYSYVDEQDYIDILRMLLKHSTNKNPTESEFYVPFRAVLRFGTSKAMQLFLENGVSFKNCGVRYPFHLAAANPHTEVPEYMLENCAFDVDEIVDTADKGQTPLFAAMYNGVPDNVKLFIEWGADVNLCQTRGEFGEQPPLFYAFARTREEIVDYLLSADARMDLRYYIDHAGQYELNTWQGKYCIKYMVLLKSQGHLIDMDTESSVLKAIPNSSETVKHCLAELETLKSIMIHDSVTLYDVLTGTDITRYLHQSQVKGNSEAQDIEDCFPLYGNQIACRFSFASVKREIINEAVKNLNKVLKYRLSLNILYEIVSKLRLKDLRNLCKIHNQIIS